MGVINIFKSEDTILAITFLKLLDDDSKAVLPSSGLIKPANGITKGCDLYSPQLSNRNRFILSYNTTTCIVKNITDINNILPIGL
tara:strand:- start:162 stop:416 length:255 start_codon:yes stop_codon:yes gene_type:complete